MAKHPERISSENTRRLPDPDTVKVAGFGDIAFVPSGTTVCLMI